MSNSDLRRLPSVTQALAHPAVAPLTERYGGDVVKQAVRDTLDDTRRNLQVGAGVPAPDALAARVAARVSEICEPSLKPVINATGIILHTNLGRAPLGQPVVNEIVAVASGYSNLEFDLGKARRGHRNEHVREILRFLTGAEDALVVNNNAAAIILALNTLGANREVIVSRGELIEIGGAFRIPEIMAAAGVRMVEVGTTNRTRLADYEAALTAESAILFKAHKSNYAIRGFTEEVRAEALAELARARGLVMVYDLGSGMLRRPEGLPLENEPDVSEAVGSGADLVTFSGDKLLGGPQAGILAGREKFIARLSRAPLMRALRVGKLTLAGLSAVCRAYLTRETLLAANPAMRMMAQKEQELGDRAERLLAELTQTGVPARIVESAGHSGGGSLPDMALKSVAVEVLSPEGNRGAAPSERLYRQLLCADPPVLAVLRQGRLLLDVLTLADDDIPVAARAVREAE